MKRGRSGNCKWTRNIKLRHGRKPKAAGGEEQQLRRISSESKILSGSSVNFKRGIEHKFRESVRLANNYYNVSKGTTRSRQVRQWQHRRVSSSLLYVSTTPGDSLTRNQSQYVTPNSIPDVTHFVWWHAKPNPTIYALYVSRTRNAINTLIVSPGRVGQCQRAN